MIAIIDYGMGNLASVAKAFRFLGGKVRITSDPKVVARAQALVLPGVGAFGEAMAELKKRRLMNPILGSIREDKPFLGLCLGLQLLFASSEESPRVRGLGVLPGRVQRFRVPKGFKVPHMGWNQIKRVPLTLRQAQGERLMKWQQTVRGEPFGSAVRPEALEGERPAQDRPVSAKSIGGSASFCGGEPRTGSLLEGVPDGAFMYFVHSFYAQPEERKMIAAVTEYGNRFPSVVWNGRRLWATQFHPEKSQKWGLKIVNNFIEQVA